MEEVFDTFLNKIIKILFKDGDEIRSIKGELVSYSDDFIKIKTFKSEFLINRSQIIKIKGDSDGVKLPKD